MKEIIIALIAFLSCHCGAQTENSSSTITNLADSYYQHEIDASPQFSYFMDIELDDHSLYKIKSTAEIQRIQEFEDSLYAEMLKIDESKLKQAELITYWILKEKIESNIEIRVCKRELWDVNHMFGVHHLWTYLADFQPVKNDTLKQQAFARWNKFPLVIDTKIENLNLGIEQGYTMPKEIVSLVIEQLKILEGYSIDASPFMSPAKRADDANFSDKWEKLVRSKVVPSITTYRTYLEKEYLNQARVEVSILELPNGDDCYRAFIREQTTTHKEAHEIFEMGSEIVESNKLKIQEIGMELYNSNDFTEIIELIGSDSSNYFNTSEEIMVYNTKIMNAAEIECEKWFDVLPSTKVSIKPYAEYEEGIGSYEAASGDKPAYYRINLKNPSDQTYYSNETLSFHEAYPGHHLQIGIEKEIEGLHNIGSLFFFGSYVEGWARYSEQLSEEMGLYNKKASLISRRAWPSRGLVIDPGLHLHRWSKDSIISFVVESGLNESIALSFYYRLIVSPAQMTSYDVGGEEIKALRRLAEEKLQGDFKIKEFHTKILENGSIPLIALRTVIEKWIESKLTTTTPKPH